MSCYEIKMKITSIIEIQIQNLKALNRKYSILVHILVPKVDNISEWWIHKSNPKTNEYLLICQKQVSTGLSFFLLNEKENIFSFHQHHISL